MLEKHQPPRPLEAARGAQGAGDLGITPYHGLRIAPGLNELLSTMPFSAGQALLADIVGDADEKIDNDKKRITANARYDVALTDRVYRRFEQDFVQLGLKAYLPPRENFQIVVTKNWMPSLRSFHGGGYSEPGTSAGRVQVGFSDSLALSPFGRIFFSEERRTNAKATLLYTAHHEATHGMGALIYTPGDDAKTAFKVGERGLAKMIGDLTGRLVLEETLATLNGMYAVLNDPTYGSRFRLQEGTEQLQLDDADSFGLPKEIVDAVASLYGENAVKRCPETQRRYVNVPTISLVGPGEMAVPSGYQAITGTAVQIATLLYMKEESTRIRHDVADRLRGDLLRQQTGHRSKTEFNIVERMEKHFGADAVRVMTGILLPHEESTDPKSVKQMHNAAALLFGALSRVLRQSETSRERSLGVLAEIVDYYPRAATIL